MPVSIITAMLLAVNYHYLSEDGQRGRAIYPISLDRFAAQLDDLARGFEFVSRSDLVAAVEQGAPLPARACLITFDDGLRQQVELGLPVLQQRGIPAVFFVCGEPLERGRALFVHKVHQLRELLPQAELRASLETELARDGVAIPAIPAHEPVETYRYDDPDTARFKYLLNVALGSEAAQAIDRLFAEHFDEASFAQRFYADADQVRELEAADALGAHGYCHKPLTRFAPGGARRDLELGAQVLERIAGVRARTVSYPYGEFVAVDRTVSAAAAAAGFSVGLTMERAFNQTLDDPLLLARLDTNDVPGGRNPFFGLDGGSIVLGQGMTRARAWYFKEEAAA